MQDTPEIQQSTGETALGGQAEAGATLAPTEARSTVEVMPSVEELLKQAELAAQEHHDAWLRAKAEADNIRKRAQVEVANAHKFALENLAAELLPVKDSLEAALATETPVVEGLKSGVELTLKHSSRFSRSSAWWRSTRPARNSIRTATRRSARSSPMPNPTPWCGSCRRGTCFMTAWCGRPSSSWRRQKPLKAEALSPYRE